MSFTLHVEVGAFGSSISELSRILFLPTTSSFGTKGFTLWWRGAILERAGRDKSSEIRRVQATMLSKLRHRARQRWAVTALQGYWTALNARTIRVTSSGIFHLGKMLGKANELLPPQLVQRVMETQPEWVLMSPVLCEWRRTWAPAICDRSGYKARSRDVSMS